MKKGNKDQESVMVRLATFVVDKRNLFFLLVIIGTIFTLFSRNWVEVENDLSSYLPIHSTTRQGLDVMEEQFTTFGTADLMVANISLEEARRVKAELLELDGVQSVEFDDTTDHYAHASALYSLTFDYDEDDERCREALDRARESLTGWDVFVSTELGNTKGDIIDAEVNVIMVYVAVIVLVVLLLTSQTYAEVPVLILTFVTAMILNLGSNFLLGKKPELGYMTMDGQEVFKFAVKKVPEIIKELLEENRTSLEEIRYFVLHQANYRIIESVAKRLKADISKFPANMEHYGNTSGGSIPLLLDEMNRKGMLAPGDKIVLSGFGAGLTWGATLVEW